MAYKWIMFLSFVWIILLIFSTTLEYKHTTATWQTANNVSTFQYLTDFKNMSYKTTGATQTFIGFNIDYFNTLYNVLTWNFSFIPEDSVAEYFRWIILTPITITALYVIGREFITLLQGFIP
jgi:hypothetical protein